MALMRWVFFENWQIMGCTVVGRLYRFSRENGVVPGGTWGEAQCALVGWWD